MTAGPHAQRQWPWSDLARWLICFALALFFHVGGVLALLARWNETPDLVSNAPIVMVELAPVAMAPQTQPTELPPGPQQTEVEPEPEPKRPIEKVEIPPDQQAESLLSVTPPKPVEKPKEKKPKETHASLTSAPSTAEQQAERAAAPTPGASSRNPYAVPSWKSLLVSQLERSKRYPTEARARGEQGVAQLAFSVDRHGGVHDARIVRSSGSELLDRETLAMVQRAQPLPPPPPELPGTQIAIVVPIRYNIR
jgi:periplasmic protein TonB